jgi:hypothetical protein
MEEDRAAWLAIAEHWECLANRVEEEPKDTAGD